MKLRVIIPYKYWNKNVIIEDVDINSQIKQIHDMKRPWLLDGIIETKIMIYS